MKTTSLTGASVSVDLHKHKRSKILKYNTKDNKPSTLGGKTLEEVRTITYFGSIIKKRGGSDVAVKESIVKAKVAFLQLRNIWDLKLVNNRVRIFKTRQIYYTELKRRELQPSSKRY